MEKNNKPINPSSSNIPSCRQLFIGFLVLSLSAFGGALPMAHRIVVNRYKWLKGEEFFEILAVSQLLPGPNVVNIAVILGSRYHKVRGALCAVAGLMVLPMLIVVGLAHVYTSYKHSIFLRDILRGIKPAAAGLMVAMGLQMLSPIVRLSKPFFVKQSIIPFIFVVLSFMAVGVFQLSLLWVLLLLSPFSITYAWWNYKNERK